MPGSVNKTQSKWYINKHGASNIIDTFEMYHISVFSLLENEINQTTSTVHAPKK
jgi:hypothetical protein